MVDAIFFSVEYSRRFSTVLYVLCTAFPGLADLLHGIEELGPEEKGRRIKELRKGFNLELSVAVTSIDLTLVAPTHHSLDCILS